MFSKLIFISLVSLLTIFSLTNCTKLQEVESFAPGDLPQAVIGGITANGGGALYCSISGGCPIQITGTNFYKKARVFVGSYECDDVVISDDFTTIDCNVGPGQNGVYDISVKNIDNQFSTIDAGVSATAVQFSYASFMYLGVQTSPGQVYGYAQHPTTGALISVSGSPFTTAGDGTYGVAISKNNKFLYSTNVSSNTVTTFAINPLTGVLTNVSGPMTTDSNGPNGLFVHPSGNFLYVSNYYAGDVSGYSIGSDGLLSQIAGSPFSASGALQINGLVASSDGRYLYAAAGGAASGTNGVVAYSVNQTTGALSLIAGSPFRNPIDGSISNRGDGISIHPNARWLYMGLYGQGLMAGWQIDSDTGALTPIEDPVSNVSSGTAYSDNGGSASSVSSDGLFLYGTAYSTNAANPKKIIVYSINPNNGGLSHASENNTDGGPNDIRIDTTGDFAYTCNTRNSPSINAFSINKVTGALSDLTPASYSIPAPNAGPGIMIMQINR
ncbi:MAG: beta-propeller fold lactonase family protein [Bdellovibrionota bacterium]